MNEIEIREKSKKKKKTVESYSFVGRGKKM